MVGALGGAQGLGRGDAGPGFAQHRPPLERAFGLGGGQFWNNPLIVKQLNLTDEQRKAMDGILQDHRLTLVDLQAHLKKAELGLEPLIQADTPDQSAILAQIDKVAQARAELEKANARFLLALRAKLTPEQWKELRTIHANRTAHERLHEHGPGDWGPDGQGQPWRGPGGRFRAPSGPPPPNAAPQGPPAQQPPGPGTGQEQ